MPTLGLDDDYDLVWADGNLYGPFGRVFDATVIEEKPKCDCGAEKCKTTHADWCSTKEK